MKKFKDFNRLYEFEEMHNTSTPEQISFMDDLYKRIKKEISPNIPSQYKTDYDRNKSLIGIHTDNKKDLTVEIKINDDKMVILIKPVNEPEFKFNYNFYNANIDSILNIIKGQFEKSETNGLYIEKSEKKERYLKSYHDENKESNDDDKEEINDDINIPIVKKPKKTKKCIDMEIIRNILEDAYILDDIDLKSTSVDELLRRMLLETRR